MPTAPADRAAVTVIHSFGQPYHPNIDSVQVSHGKTSVETAILDIQEYTVAAQNSLECVWTKQT